MRIYLYMFLFIYVFILYVFIFNCVKSKKLFDYISDLYIFESSITYHEIANGTWRNKAIQTMNFAVSDRAYFRS